MSRSVWIGWEPREAAAFAVAAHSIRQRSDIPVHGIVLADLRASGLYQRPTEVRDGKLWDVISAAPCSTEFSISRFLIKELAGTKGWALFMDSDMLVRGDIGELFDLCDPDKALMCVKHDHRPTETIKMDGQVQTTYSRKNWSSVFALNLEHAANAALTVDLVNSVPGRDLHRFCWLDDGLIGALPVRWNWLAGYSDPLIDPAICHHTEGSPCMDGYADVPFADEWRDVLNDWAKTPGYVDK